MPELVNCPHCEKKLRVPDNLLGRMVKCPTCGKTFTAEAESASPPQEERPAARSSSVTPRADDDRPSRRSRVDDEDEDEDRPRRRPARDEDEDDEDRPRRRRSRLDDDDEDEDEDDRPSRRRPRRRGNLKPHRGGLILFLGIFAFFCCGIILGPVAFFMGNSDIAEMDAGRMDPSGRGMTNAGRICGIIAGILSAILIVLNIVVNLANQ